MIDIAKLQARRQQILESLAYHRTQVDLFMVEVAAINRFLIENESYHQATERYQDEIKVFLKAQEEGE